MSNLPEFDETAAIKAWNEACGVIQLNALSHCKDWLEGARWQFKQDKARIALADKDALEAAEIVNGLKAGLTKVTEELNLIKAEREMVASGKLNCADCGAILARF